MASFYAGENFRYPVVDALRRLGHDVRRIQSPHPHRSLFLAGLIDEMPELRSIPQDFEIVILLRVLPLGSGSLKSPSRRRLPKLRRALPWTHALQHADSARNR